MHDPGGVRGGQRRGGLSNQPQSLVNLEPSPAGQEVAQRLTVPELRRLLNILVRTPRPDLDHAADWSWWRGRRQAQARAAHYRARGQAPP